ncbi:MAG: glycosyltransferase, partial [Chloroflexi bacterium]|nr:glycosyltransferase [Chloroflexota bacterium]
FPAYNDGGTIASMVITALQALREVADDYEVVVVQNGSTDYTRDVLAELQKLYPRELRVINYPYALGYGGALRTGFAACTKDLIFYTDGDAQYDPRELLALFKALPVDVDMVNGYKIHRNDPIGRKIIGRLYHHAVRITFGLRLRDVDCDFRLIRRDVLDVIHLDSNTGIICVELMKRIQEAGFRIEQVPVHHYHRAFGVSQFFNFQRVARTLLDLAGLWYRLVLRGEARCTERTALVPRAAPAEVGAANGVSSESRR